VTALERVAQVFRRTFSLAAGRKVDAETTPDHVPEWDSIGHMNLVSGLEKEFGLRFEVDEIMEMSSVAKILELLAKRGVNV